MEWNWAGTLIALFISLWAISISRLLSLPSCLPSLPNSLSSRSGKKRNVLFVMAHPDDESMFFSPTINYLVSEGHLIHLLCISVGNADGLGNTRKEELYCACTVLKILSEQIKILDHPNLQDGFNNKWDHNLLAGVIEDHIKMWNIDTVITFDKCGVSGHPNHRDVHHAVRKLQYGNLQNDIDTWELISMSILRKYSGPLTIWISVFLSSWYQTRNMLLLLNRDPLITYHAMSQHKSQWVWFRKLFVGFSSYTYMNTLRKIN